MLVVPQTILVLGTDVRSGAFAGPEEAETEKCLDEVISGRAKDGSCQQRALPIRHDDARSAPGAAPSASSRSRATRSPRSPARGRRRSTPPTPRAARSWRYGRSRACSGSTSTRSRSSTSTAFAASSTRSAGSTSTCRRRSARRLRRRLQASTSSGREPPRRVPGDHPRAHALEHLRDGRVHRHRRRARPVPAADPRRDQGQADQHHGAADELRQGAADRLERAQGDGLEHGRADDAPARDLGGDRRRRNRRAQALGDDGGRQPRRLARGVRARGGGAARARSRRGNRTARRS